MQDKVRCNAVRIGVVIAGHGGRNSGQISTGKGHHHRAKSLAEGFGLTVSEGMWKGRPIIGSAVGGIIDQIADGTGILLPDPNDLEAFGQAARLLLADHAQATQLGQAAHAYVREHCLGDIHLMRYATLLGSLPFGD
jgi:glycosyltransferase involved in cell wall biosynthesis